MKCTKLLPLLFLFLNASAETVKNKHIVFSQDTQSECQVFFKDLLADGLSSHPSISMSKDILEGAEHGVDSAFWGYFPTPSVDVSVVDKDKTQTTFRLDQPLWTGGELDSTYEKAKAKKDEALHSYDEYQYKLIENYVTTLENYLQAERNIEVLNDNKRQFNDLHEMLDRMITAGISSDSDKNLLQSRLAMIYSDLVVAKAKLKVSKIQFEILGSKQIDCNVKFQYTELFTSNIDIEKLIEDELNFHPSLKEIDAQIRSAISEVDRTKSKIWPNLILRAEHREGSIYDEIAEPADQNLLYVTFQFTPGAGLSSLSNINEAKMNVSKVRYQKSTKEKELIDALMNDYTSYVAAKSDMEVISEDIRTLEEIYKSNKRLFLLQEKKWLDLVNSLSELNKQKINYSQKYIQKKMLEYKMFLKTGKIDLNTGKVNSDI